MALFFKVQLDHLSDLSQLKVSVLDNLDLVMSTQIFAGLWFLVVLVVLYSLPCLCLQANRLFFLYYVYMCWQLTCILLPLPRHTSVDDYKRGALQWFMDLAWSCVYVKPATIFQWSLHYNKTCIIWLLQFCNGWRRDYMAADLQAKHCAKQQTTQWSLTGTVVQTPNKTPRGFPEIKYYKESRRTKYKSLRSAWNPHFNQKPILEIWE